MDGKWKAKGRKVHSKIIDPFWRYILLEIIYLVDEEKLMFSR